MATSSQVWDWKTSSNPFCFKHFKSRILGLMGREVAESCAWGTFDMRPSGLLLFLMMSTQTSTPCPEHLLCSPQRPVTAIYQIYCTMSPLSSWMLNLGASLACQEGWALGKKGGGVKCPSCALCSLLNLWFILPNNALGRWSIYILGTRVGSFCWQWLHLSLLLLAPLKHWKQCPVQGKHCVIVSHPSSPCYCCSFARQSCLRKRSTRGHLLRPQIDLHLSPSSAEHSWAS